MGLEDKSVTLYGVPHCSISICCQGTTSGGSTLIFGIKSPDLNNEMFKLQSTKLISCIYISWLCTFIFPPIFLNRPHNTILNDLLLSADEQHKSLGISRKQGLKSPPPLRKRKKKKRRTCCCNETKECGGEY